YVSPSRRKITREDFEITRMATSEKSLYIDIPVKLPQLKIGFSIAALAFEGDLPASIFHLQLITKDVGDWNAENQIIAVFHTNAGHVTLNDNSTPIGWWPPAIPTKSLSQASWGGECKLSYAAQPRQLTTGEMRICFPESKSTRTPCRECLSSRKMDSWKSPNGIELKHRSKSNAS